MDNEIVIERWWKNPKSEREFKLANGKTLRQTTLDMYALMG